MDGCSSEEIDRLIPAALGAIGPAASDALPTLRKKLTYDSLSGRARKASRAAITQITAPPPPTKKTPPGGL